MQSDGTMRVKTVKPNVKSSAERRRSANFAIKDYEEENNNVIVEEQPQEIQNQLAEEAAIPGMNI